MTGPDEDLSLLRAHEPVVRYTAGELFLPTAVEPYVAHAALWEVERASGPRCLVPAGELTIERLVEQARARPEADLSLRFVDSPLDHKAYRAWRARPDRPAFRSGGRFTQVGLLARVIDAPFRLTLVLRGRVPGGLAAAAERAYRRHLDPDHHPYYGRVVREAGYVALQYWFFYAMNDWRSSFGGANDHEADWEQVTVYLAAPPEGGLRPAWVAFSAHDEVGDDLRRRWDDPDLVRAGDHPVVFAGAGSHSGAFVAGDYVTAVDPPGALQGVFRVLRAIARVLTPWSRGEVARGVGIPFVDYARGDGEGVGEGQARAWSPVLIDDSTPWARHFAGLWGLDTRDRFGGERAPAGPRYERDGTVRRSWSDPLGWAGLQKVPLSPAESASLLGERIAEIDRALPDLDADIARHRQGLRRLTAELGSLHDRDGMAALAAERQVRVVEEERAMGALVARRTALATERAAHEDTLARPPAVAPPQAHLRHKALPAGQVTDARPRLLRGWSTVSTPLLLIAAAFLLVDHRLGVVAGITLFVVVFLTIEAVARGRLISFALSLLVVAIGGLLGVAVVQGVLGRWELVLASLLGVAAGAVLVANLRDLRRG
ncbi:MAG: hypothetical protein GEV08_11360 [Acidimicrobiia bacterium]|nr:hypothetical protein [Acidimicrobiia bacterium]